MGLHSSMVRLVLRHPSLIPALLALSWASRPRRWYLRSPYLPIPPAPYLRWRMETAYGDGTHQPPQREGARYLRWTWRMRRAR
ncbi:MAG: hypothetical protein WEG36_01050 [Gemmatimonadota bacterium]